MPRRPEVRSCDIERANEALKAVKDAGFSPTLLEFAPGGDIRVHFDRPADDQPADRAAAG
jgi:hypothetical protein